MIITPQLPINLLESFIPKHPNVLVNPPAFWIKNTSYSEQNEIDPSQRELQFFLIDHQHNLDTEELYTRSVKKVLPSGVEKASTFSIGFDPIYESIILHHCVIYRDGKQVNAFLSGNARILQRELSLERHIYDGSLTLLLIFSNIKIGDVLDISYTRKGRNPVFSGHFDVIQNFSYPEKIEKFSLRFVRNKNRPLHFKTYNASSLLKEQVLNDSQIETSYVVTSSSVVENSNIPNWHLYHELVQASDFQSWQEVSVWGKKLFHADEKIEIDEVKNLVAKWKNEGKNKIELAAAALHFVQNEIRYLGMEEGVYSHQPHPPQTTLSNRYGDCKDKTALLKVFMDEIGIVSTPALVGKVHANQIKGFFPCAVIFNHVILNVKIDDEFYWLDATSQYQGGSLKNQSKLCYGAYLLLNGEEECMITNLPVSSPSDVDLEAHYIFSADESELRIKTTFKQAIANEQRSVIAYHGKEGLEKLYQDFFSHKFGSAQIKEPISIADDLELNQITILESYILQPLNPNDTKFNIPVYIIHQHLPSPVSLSRKQPLSLVYPMRISESFRISSQNQSQLSVDSITLEHPSFFFSCQFSQKDQDVVCKYVYETKTDHILPEDFGSLRNIISKINEKLFLDYHYSNNQNPKSLEGRIKNTKTSDKKFFSGVSMFFIIIAMAKLVFHIFRLVPS